MRHLAPPVPCHRTEEWICVMICENDCRGFLAETLMHISIKRRLSLNCIITIRLRGEKAEGGCSMMLNMFVLRSCAVS